MARCESSGMRRDRIMMTERRKNRRTEEKKARLAAEAAAKASSETKTAVHPQQRSPDAVIPKTENAKSPNDPTMSPHCPPSIDTIVKTELPGDSSPPLQTQIIPKMENISPKTPSPVNQCSPTQLIPNSSLQHGGLKMHFGRF